MDKSIEKEKQIYDFIVSFMQENNYSPSYKEIMEGCGLKSLSGINWYINKMCAEGKLKVTKNPDILPRTIVPEGYAFTHSGWIKIINEQPPLGKEVMCTVTDGEKRDIKFLVRLSDGWYMDNEKIECTVIGWKEKPVPCE